MNISLNGMAGTGQRCAWCGMYQAARCPQVSALEYHPNGSVKRVEFITPLPIGPTDYSGLKPVAAYDHASWVRGESNE